jgi:hypothetical protein
MFGAGMIKLRGDTCWRDLTCLVYHYQTQPMPNPLSWYFNRLSLPINKAGVLFNHFAEVLVPFGYLVPWAWLRRSAGVITILFQLSIIASGNLSWLNWLTLVLAISCFDDRFLAHLVPVHAGVLTSLALPHQVALGVLVVLVALLSIKPAINLISRNQAMNASFEPLHLVNTYGAFGSISRKRFEVVLEGTTDSVITAGSTWTEYQFKAKPGNLARRPPWIAPYHLRLDWLMWFAALSPAYADGWFVPLAVRLLQNDGPTLALLAGNPFSEAPPRLIRARLYEYRFTTALERKQSGNWWARTLVDEFMRPISLQTPGLVASLEQRGWVY